MTDLPKCRVPGCNNPVGGPGTKCGTLCYDCWSSRSSSSLSKVVDDPDSPGGGPEPGDPTEEEIYETARKIRESRKVRGSKDNKPTGSTVYKIHLPDGITMDDFDDD